MAKRRQAGRVSDRDRKRMTKQQVATREISPNMADLMVRQGETLSILDKLRATRKMRGGVGPPLVVPGHLHDAAAGKPAIIITDAETDLPKQRRSRAE